MSLTAEATDFLCQKICEDQHPYFPCGMNSPRYTDWACCRQLQVKDWLSTIWCCDLLKIQQRFASQRTNGDSYAISCTFTSEVQLWFLQGLYQGMSHQAPLCSDRSLAASHVLMVWSMLSASLCCCKLQYLETCHQHSFIPSKGANWFLCSMFILLWTFASFVSDLML